jgi:hypothetical protein
VVKSLIVLIYVFSIFGCTKNGGGVDDTNSSERNLTIPEKPEETQEVDDEVTPDEPDDSIADSGDIDTGSETTTNKEKMEFGVEYKLYKGDKILENSEARLRIVRNSERDYTDVQLLSGEATIYRGEE